MRLMRQTSQLCSRHHAACCSPAYLVCLVFGRGPRKEHDINALQALTVKATWLNSKGMHIDGDSRVLAAWQRAAQSSWTAEVSASCFDEVKGALLEKWLIERMQPANHTSPEDKELLEAHAHAHRNDANTEIDQDAQRSSAPNPSTLYNDPDLLLAIENGDDELSEMLAHCVALEAKARLLDAEAPAHAQMAKALEAAASIAGSSAMQKARQKDTKAAETEALRGHVEVLAQRDCVESLRALEGTVNITAGLFASAAGEGFLICRPREAEAEALQSWQRALAHSMARATEAAAHLSQKAAGLRNSAAAGGLFLGMVDQAFPATAFLRQPDAETHKQLMEEAGRVREAIASTNMALVRAQAQTAQCKAMRTEAQRWIQHGSMPHLSGQALAEARQQVQQAKRQAESLEKDVLPAAAMAAGRAADALFAAQESMLRTLHMRLEASTHARLQDVALDNAAYTEIHRVLHVAESEGLMSAMGVLQDAAVRWQHAARDAALEHSELVDASNRAEHALTHALATLSNSGMIAGDSSSANAFQGNAGGGISAGNVMNGGVGGVDSLFSPTRASHSVTTGAGVLEPHDRNRAAMATMLAPVAASLSTSNSIIFSSGSGSGHRNGAAGLAGLNVTPLVLQQQQQQGGVGGVASGSPSVPALVQALSQALMHATEGLQGGVREALPSALRKARSTADQLIALLEPHTFTALAGTTTALAGQSAAVGPPQISIAARMESMPAAAETVETMNGIGSSSGPCQVFSGAGQQALLQAAAAKGIPPGQGGPQRAPVATGGGGGGGVGLLGLSGSAVHPNVVMRGPQLSALMVEGKAAAASATAAIQALVERANQAADACKARGAETWRAERCVMADFYARPEKLFKYVGELQAQLHQLQSMQSVYTQSL